MDNIQDVIHRWRASLEEKQPLKLPTDQIKEDVAFLLKRVRELEQNLADALNPVSSAAGQLTLLKDGVLFYRLNGMFVPVSAITQGLKFLVQSEERLTKGMKQELEEMLKILKEVFKGDI